MRIDVAIRAQSHRPRGLFRALLEVGVVICVKASGCIREKSWKNNIPLFIF
jgi:hypothetical protein